MNAEKLKKLQADVRIGGKGTARRKKKIIHRMNVVDDKKLQSTLKKVNCNPIPGIEEVNMFKTDGSVLHFNNPKVQLALSSNMIAVSGSAETRQIGELLPKVLNQLGPEQLLKFCNLQGSQRPPAQTDANGDDDDDDDIPALVENFEEATMNEEKVVKTGETEAAAKEPEEEKKKEEEGEPKKDEETKKEE